MTVEKQINLKNVSVRYKYALMFNVQVAWLNGEVEWYKYLSEREELMKLSTWCHIQTVSAISFKPKFYFLAL